VGDVIHDAHGEVVARRFLADLVQDRLDHGGCELLGREAVAPAHHTGVFLQGRRAGVLDLPQGRDDVQVERLAHRAGLLGAVQDGHRPDRGREALHEILHDERAVESDLEQADLLPARNKGLHRLVGRLRGGAHENQHPLGFRMSHVVEQAIGAAGALGEPVHQLLDGAGTVQVEAVGRLPGLEEGVRVLGRSPQHRAVRRQGPPAMGLHPLLGDQEGNAGLQGRHLGQAGEVMGLLDRAGGQQAEAGLPAGHDVRVIREDGEGVGGHGPRRDVNDGGRQLAGHLVHVGDHQEKALGRREGGGQGARLQRAVHGSRGAAFRLHLHDLGKGAPDVPAAMGRPLVSSATSPMEEDGVMG